ncbi:MAG: formate C-acetyltransferase/glycerol dehydratase family glycyl radical enzyme, partial [Bacteroidales bacterium]|nr:formate C-acetyltransferase/glycerol dehydratase family glycyl radical enzyme [Bacteroidales bacterium]
MNNRIKKLRTQSTQTRPALSAERARLITAFYKNTDTISMSIPIQRAKAFDHILRHKQICINEGEWIVGERGPGPQQCPTYPEICVHSLNDLNMLKNREKVPFYSDEETSEIYKNEIIPFWHGHSIRDKMFETLPKKWKDAYEAGV